MSDSRYAQTFCRRVGNSRLFCGYSLRHTSAWSPGSEQGLDAAPPRTPQDAGPAVELDSCGPWDAGGGNQDRAWGLRVNSPGAAGQGGGREREPVLGRGPERRAEPGPGEGIPDAGDGRARKAMRLLRTVGTLNWGP